MKPAKGFQSGCRVRKVSSEEGNVWVVTDRCDQGRTWIILEGSSLTSTDPKTGREVRQDQGYPAEDLELV